MKVVIDYDEVYPYHFMYYPGHEFWFDKVGEIEVEDSLIERYKQYEKEYEFWQNYLDNKLA